MDAQAANELRLRILRLHLAGCPPREIALRAGCHISTVYRVLDDPAPDRRPRAAPPNPDEPPAMPPGLSPGMVANIRLLAAEDPDRSALEIHAILYERHHPTDPDPLPSVRTVARALRALRHAPAPARPPDPPDPDDVPDPRGGAACAAPSRAGGWAEARGGFGEDEDPPDLPAPNTAIPDAPSPESRTDPTASAQPFRTAPDWLVAQLFEEYDDLPDDASSVLHEVRLLRLLNRQAGHELFYGQAGPRARRLLRAQICEISRGVVQALRAAAAIRPRDASQFGVYVDRLEKALNG